MKVMIVDDEPMVIEHLKHLIPWEDHGYELTESSYDGNSALTLYKINQPQIMIVDIRMPSMDGLELIRAVTSMNPAVKFIVMSAYQDFEYAQQAIEIGVSGYWVKHTMEEKKLLSELAKVKACWEADEQARKYMQQNQLKNLITRGEAYPEWEFKAGQLALILVQADLPYSFSSSTERDQMRIMDSCISENAAVAHLADWQLEGEFAIQDTQIIFLMSANMSCTKSAGEELDHFFILFQEDFRLRYSQTVSIFYQFHDNNLQTLPQVYDRLRLAAHYTLFCGREARLDVRELPLQKGRNDDYRLDGLVDAMEHGPWEVVERTLKQRFESVSQPAWNLDGLQESVIFLKKTLKALYRKMGISEEQRLSENCTDLPEIYNIRELYQFFLEQYQKAFDKFHNFTLSPRLHLILQYIHAHYNEDINIEDVAYANGISASYTHLLFKRELGRTFLDYVTDTRMLHAKRILQSEQAKMSEVAEKVGYHSAQYFSQVFKKFTGMLPHEYRRRNGLS